MDEKSPLITSAGSASPESRNKTRSLMIVIAFVLILLWHPSKTNWTLPSRREPVTMRYPGEKISWEACGDVNGYPLECSKLEVPMDQYNNTSSDKTFHIPLIRLRGKEGAKSLLHNVGGPGGSGIEYMRKKGNFLASLVGDGYHVLSFDPRGVGGSEPQAHCYANADSKRSLHKAPDYYTIKDNVKTWAWTKNFVQSCSDSSGEHGKYINTVQTAADMNSILDAIGQKELVYWGWSYGTLLGQTYASLFPDRVGRVMFDGVCNSTDWFLNPIFYLNQLVDADKVLEGFFEECVRAGDHCPLAEFGKTQQGLQSKVMSFVDGLDAEPLSVYVNNTHWGTLTREKIMGNALFQMLYRPTDWPEAARRLTKMLKGNATEAFLEYGFDPPWYTSMEDSNDIVCANDGVTGPEYFPQSRKEVLDLILPALNISQFTSSAATGVFKKSLWKIPKTHNYTQKEKVKTAHPILIFSSTYDPVTPLRSAEWTKKIFTGSEIVESKAYGHGAAALPSKCVAKHIRAYLYNGTIPNKHSYCDIDWSYFGQETMQQFDNEEDQVIYHAQLELARDRPIPAW